MSRKPSLSERQMGLAVDLQAVIQKLLSASMDLTSTLVDYSDLQSDSALVSDSYAELADIVDKLDVLLRDGDEEGG